MPAALWEAARQQARAAAGLEDLPARIIGTDIDEGVLGLARFHAEQAGVAADIHFQRRTFAEFSSKQPYGCVICNPPYGQRLSEAVEALALYRACPTSSPPEDLVVLHPDGPARTWRSWSATGHAAAEAVQRADRMHVLPVPRPAAAAKGPGGEEIARKWAPRAPATDAEIEASFADAEETEPAEEGGLESSQGFAKPQTETRGSGTS